MTIIVLILFFAGLTLFLLGIIYYFNEEEKNVKRDLSFISMGSLLLIPGIFYLIKLIKACITNNKQERLEILSDFPLEAEWFLDTLLNLIYYCK